MTAGFFQAYTRTDSVDAFLPLPPPYTPNADDPLPIIYQLAACQSVPDIHSGLVRGRGAAGPGAGAGPPRGPAPPRPPPPVLPATAAPPSHSRPRPRGRHHHHRRRRSRGAPEPPEDRSALIPAAQDCNSSPEDNYTAAQPPLPTNTAHTDSPPLCIAGNDNNTTPGTCDGSNALTENLAVDGGGEFIELGDTLTTPGDLDLDSVSGASGSLYSAADTASGCSTLDQSSSTGKTHRRSVSGVSCASKSSVEPSVSKVDEEPADCCKCSNCKSPAGSTCSECQKLKPGDEALNTQHTEKGSRKADQDSGSDPVVEKLDESAGLENEIALTLVTNGGSTPNI